MIQYTSVTATQPASHPASHVAVAITLNAKASSLKTRIVGLPEGSKSFTIGLATYTIIIIIIQTFVRRTLSALELNLRRR